MDRAIVTYLVDGSTANKEIEGGHLLVQMLARCTLVHVSDYLGAPVTRVHIFRDAEYVDLERGITFADSQEKR